MEVVKYYELRLDMARIRNILRYTLNYCIYKGGLQ